MHRPDWPAHPASILTDEFRCGSKELFGMARGLSGYNDARNATRGTGRAPTMKTVPDNKTLTGTWKDGQMAAP